MQTLHLVSHTHWDREWYLTYQQFRIKLVHLVDNLLEILEKDSAYRHFMLDGQTIVLEDYLAIRPEQEAVLRDHVASGRVLIGPWYVLPDEFLVSPEATIRNLLEGDRVARRFGPKMMVGYIPDPFGHIGQMPQILRGFGIDSASVMRGLADQPCEFWWESPDGSRVLMAYLREGYGNAAGILNGSLESFASEVQTTAGALAGYAAAPHLLLMQGTDHMEPQAGTPAAIAFTQGKLEGLNLVHSMLPAYLADVRAALDGQPLPVVTGELRACMRHPLLPGVLSTRMWIKQRNRACETLLEKWAEPMSAWAECLPVAAGAPERLAHPQALLREAWRLLMQCHPHDSICGCSIDQVHAEMVARFDQVEQIGEAITQQSLEALARQISTEVTSAKASANASASAVGIADSAIVVFNPSAGPRTDLVSVVLETLPPGGDFELVDEQGRLIPFQRVGLGGSDVLNMSMNRSAFNSSYRMVADGVLNGLKIQSAQSRRADDAVFIDVLVTENGEPNLAAWEQGRQEMECYLADPGLQTYHIRVRSTSAAQVLFAAPEVPGYGYRTFWVRGKPAEAKAGLQLNGWARALLPLAARAAGSPVGQRLAARLAGPQEKPPYSIENEFFRVTVEPQGTLAVEDKTSGARYSGLNRFVDQGDRGDTYNFSAVPGERPVEMRVKQVRVDRGSGETPVQQTLVLSLELRVPAALEANRQARTSRTVLVPITSQVTLVRGVARIDVHTTVENRASDHRLRVHFPAPFAVNTYQTDGHFELVRRPVDLPAVDPQWVEQPRPEAPQRAFTAIEGPQAGLAIANRGLPEVEVLRRADGCSEIALTLLRCVGWLSRDDFPERKGHAGPFMATPGAQMHGSWAFDYAILPYPTAEQAATFQRAYAFESPLRAVTTGLHSSPRLHNGPLPAEGAWVAVSPAEFVLSAVKLAEEGPGWLVRGYNLSDQALNVRLRPLLNYQHAERANLAEESYECLTPGPDGELTFQAGPHEIVSVRFR